MDLFIEYYHSSRVYSGDTLKCSGSLFHIFDVEDKKEHKYELILADGSLYHCMLTLVVVVNGIKLKDGVYASPFIILYITTNLK